MNEQQNKVNSWHDEAMALAELAFFAKKKDNIGDYYRYIQRSLNYEKAAARILKDSFDIEPSRSILYEGAINFALNLDYFEEAKQLLNEALEENAFSINRETLELLKANIPEKERTKSRILAVVNNFLDGSEDLTSEDIDRAINASIAAESIYLKREQNTIDQFLNRLVLRVFLQNKNLVHNPDYQIFEEQIIDKRWLTERKESIPWSFWKAYKIYLDKKNFASTTIRKLDLLTDDILARIGDPSKTGNWGKRGMIVGDVQSGKTSNYLGLMNKAADLGFRIIIVLSGLYENLRQQTQNRVDEGFIGIPSDLNDPNAGRPFGVELYRTPKGIPVHPITRAGDAGDLRRSALPNLPTSTNDYYVIVAKKNPAVLATLLNWLYSRGDISGDFRIIRNIPLLVIDDEADYASINVDNDFVSKINGSIRAILSLFEKSAFIGYTATPFANVFISDYNNTAGSVLNIGGKSFQLGEDLFPKDFIINLPPPSNYIGYSKVFDTNLKNTNEYVEGTLPMVTIVNDFDRYIPLKHRKNDDLPNSIPLSLEIAIKSFFIVCAVRFARGQQKEHNSMLIHVSWYVNWIDKIAFLVNEYVQKIRERILRNDRGVMIEMENVWKREFANQSNKIVEQLDYSDPRLIQHTWDEIQFFINQAIFKIEVRAVHGSKRDLLYTNNTPLNYSAYKNGLSVIAVGGNKLSRGLTLEGLSISYFLRASRFYDTLLQMGRWFGYRPGYVDLCRLFTTEELITWYQFIANATEELKDQFDVMDLSEQTPQNFGLKVRTAPGMLMISSTAKIRGATDLSLSFSGDLQETYVLSKSEQVLNENLRTLHRFLEKLGIQSGNVRQGQKLIWEKLKYGQIDEFIADYKTSQLNIYSNFIRGYVARQLRNENLSNWTVVLVNNSNAKEHYEIKTSHSAFDIGYTFRKEVEETDSFGNIVFDRHNYFIRKSHIISPPHEYLDMDETDQRFLSALDKSRRESRASVSPSNPVGKFVRKYRGSKNALLLIYILDPKGFRGKPATPAIGYAISFPEIENDEKIPYKVNQQFIEEMFGIPEEAEENPEEEEV